MPRPGQGPEEESRQQHDFNLGDTDEHKHDYSIVPDLVIGERCFTTPGNHNAQVKFVGKIDALPSGYWVGVQFDDKVGKNNGSIKGKVYFHCPPGHGGFLRSTKVFNQAAVARGKAEEARLTEERERKRNMKAKEKAMKDKEAADRALDSGNSLPPDMDSADARAAADGSPRAADGMAENLQGGNDAGVQIAPSKTALQRRRAPRGPGYACAANCKAAGSGLQSVQCGTLAQFTITAYDEMDVRCPKGGSHISVTIRGRASLPGTQPSQIRTKIVDRSDGTYQVEYKAWMSGTYVLAILVEGEPLPGSPFNVSIITMKPEASLCTLKGEGLEHATSRKPTKFEVAFIDSTGMPALAEELDVFIEPAWEPSRPSTSDGAAAGMTNPDSPNMAENNAGPASHSQSPSYSPSGRGRSSGRSSRTSRAASPTSRAASRAGTSRSPSPTARGASSTSRCASPTGGYLGLRVDAATRQQHEALWASRASVDKWMAKVALEKGSRKKNLSDWEPNFAQELSMTDPYGFAFGGLSPGILHAKGKIAKVHTVQYSVGLAGKYKLHVNLRQQMLPLPGSPFNLTVSPGPGYAGCTRIPLEGASLSGTASEGFQFGMKLQLSDMLGNNCDVGGAKVKFEMDFKAFVKQRPQYEQLPPPVTCRIDDNGDGSYDLWWSCLLAGEFPVNVMLDRKHVEGSPLTLTVLAAAPSVPHFVLSGNGLKTATAGDEAVVMVKIMDCFGNAALPTESTTFGFEVMSSGEPGSAIANTRARQDKKAAGTKATSSKSDAKRNQYVTGVNDAWCTAADSMPIEMTWLRGSKGNGEQGESEVLEIFKKYDVDGSGDIDLDELQDALKELGLPCDRTQTEVILKRFASRTVAVPGKSSANGEKAREILKTELSFNEFTFLVKEIRRSLKESGQTTSLDGTCRIGYVPQEAGSNLALHAWSFDEKGDRMPLPGSPFDIEVKVGSACASGSYVHANEATPDLVECGSKLAAGDKLVVRMQVRDVLGNDTAAPQGAVTASLETPDGASPARLEFVEARSGQGVYELSIEPSQAGAHTMRVCLHDVEVSGSPLQFTVLPAAYVPNEPKSVQRCKLSLPKSAPTPTINAACNLLLVAFDKYGNRLTVGGNRVEAKASGAATTACTVEDHNNGTYTISFSAGVPGEVKITARVESMEIGPPLVVPFVRPEQKAEQKVGAKEQPEEKAVRKEEKVVPKEEKVVPKEEKVVPKEEQVVPKEEEEEEEVVPKEEEEVVPKDASSPSSPHSTFAAQHSPSVTPQPDEGVAEVLDLEELLQPGDAEPGAEENNELMSVTESNGERSVPKPTLPIPKKRSPIKGKGKKGEESPKSSPKAGPKTSPKSPPKDGGSTPKKKSKKKSSTKADS